MNNVLDRVLQAIARVGRTRRVAVLAVALVLVVAAAALIPGIRVSTSRYGLVAADNPYQARLLGFYDKFGFPDAPTLVVAGGSPQQRRAIVDDLSRELETVEALQGRVFGRMQPEVLAEVLFLQDPAALVEFSQRLPPSLPLRDVVQGGLAGWMGALEQLLLSGLGTADRGKAGDGAGAPADGASAGEEQLPQVLGALRALANALRNHLEGGDVFADLPLSQALQGREGIDAHGYLVAGDGALHLVTLFPDLPDDEAQALEPLVQRIRDVRDDVLANHPPELRAPLTGVPALAVDELRLLRRGLVESSIVAAIGVYVLCLLFFRSLRQATIALLPLGVGILCTLGIVRLLYGELNLITSSFVAVLLGLGIDFSVHIISRTNEGLRDGLPAGEAVIAAVRKAGPGIVTGTIATSLAFLTIITTEFTAYAQLGVITAVGLGAIMVSTFFLLPAVTAATPQGGKVPAKTSWFGVVPVVIRRFQWPILVLAVATGIAGAFALPKIRYNPNHFDFLPGSTESAQALKLLENDPIGSPLFANLAAPSVEEARVMVERLRDLDTVSGVQTATDLLPPLAADRLAALRLLFGGDAQPDFAALRDRKVDPEGLARQVRNVEDALDEIRFALNQGGRDTAAVEQTLQAFEALRKTLLQGDAEVRTRLAALEQTLAQVLSRAWTTARAVAQRGSYLPSDLPPLFRRRFAAKDGSALAIYAVAKGDVWDPEIGGHFVKDIEAIDPSASGQAISAVEHNRMIVEGFEKAALYATVLILVVLVIDFRSIVDALLALAPTLLGWLWMLGIMATVGLRFDVANIVVLPVVIGIGIAFGVHLMHRCRESEGITRGPGDLDEIVRGTGGAVITAALTTMIGFGALMVGEYGAFKTLGSVMVLGIATTLVASVCVLPAILRALGRAR